ncbi:MAG: hypothetical protein A2X11_11615 [Bacteroidetes bacterium GWE2_42_24]|nr:MAG: hypothetical protein A2X11_11615 [Bacteroidetes bacterium GWE2_42_24]OFY31465.1 MAG: hypothetical protein A2X09_13865 [Bacteroidetes bacterium GWF2_43_11]
MKQSRVQHPTPASQGQLQRQWIAGDFKFGVGQYLKPSFNSRKNFFHIDQKLFKVERFHIPLRGIWNEDQAGLGWRGEDVVLV